MKHLSIKVKFFLAITAVAVVFIATLTALNLFFYDDYDLATRKASLTGIYNTVLNSYDGDIDAITATLDAMENRNAVRIAIIDTDDSVLYASSYVFGDDKFGKAESQIPPAGQNTEITPPSYGSGSTLPEMFDEKTVRMRGASVLFSLLSSVDLTALDKGGHYEFSTLTLHGDDRYLSLAGALNVNGEYLITYVPYAFIEQNSSFNMAFLLITGALALLICILIAYPVSRQFTRPLIAMNDVANSMTTLDFSKKYEGHGGDEIGQLGQSLNRLSAYLEEAIGDLQQSNDQLAQEIRKKEQIDNMRREFIINVSHELKTPIALIQGYAEGLQYGVANNPEDQKFYCDTITDEANHMNKLVMQLLSLSRLEIGGEQTYFEEISLHELCQENVAKLQVLCDSRGLSIGYDDTNETVRSDGDMLSQVLSNYLTNAVRYTRQGGHIEVTTQREESGAVLLRVFNEGDGLPEDELPKIWEKFYRTDQARTREAGGTGIGLSLVKAIAETLGGDCGAENVPGGITFWFRIPDHPGDAA